MQLTTAPYQLKFLHPFGVSSNTRTETLSIFVKLESDGIAGYGEACLPAYLGETAEGTSAFFQKAATVLKFADERPIAEINFDIDELESGNNAAKAAIDIALHDLQGKKTGRPVYELLGLDRPEPKQTSFTIGIDTPEKLEQKILEASAFQVLKIKAGTSDDRALIHQIRRYTDKPLYVDVNQGWKDKHMVLDMIGWMKEENVLLVEQPMPVSMIDEMAWVKERSSLPIIADESVKRAADLVKVKGAFSGVNVKLMKTTGIAEALTLIKEARRMKIKVMLGCMAESSCGTAAMSHMLSLADFVDLDAPLLYRNDPFEGWVYNNGMVTTPDKPGIGVKPRDFLFQL